MNSTLQEIKAIRQAIARIMFEQGYVPEGFLHELNLLLKQYQLELN